MLSQNQIDTLFRFTEYQGVEYYDLQVELVDHLAMGIEEKLLEMPELSPYDALLKVYGAFGKKGFRKLISEKEKMLQQANTDKWLHYAKRYLSIPKISLTALIFTSVYRLSEYCGPDLRSTLVQLFLVLCLFGQSLYLGWLWRDCNKKLLLTSYNSIFQLTGFFIPYLILFFVHDGIYSRFFFSCLITAFFVLTAAAVELNRLLKTQAFKMYPGAFVTV